MKMPHWLRRVMQMLVTGLRALKRILIERPSDRMQAELERRHMAALARISECLNDVAPVCVDPVVVEARIAAEQKQSEVAQRLGTLIDHVQELTGKTDTLWKEYERRQHADPTSPYYRPENDRRTINVGPPITH